LGFTLPGSLGQVILLGRSFQKGIKCKNVFGAGRQWLMPVILATQDTEIRRIVI
jgi:hypothetical protein